MVVWDGVAAGFLFFWLIGLMSELQRTELLSLDNFMHLPVSPTGAFFINYVGSSIGLSLILFLPAMIGLGIGLTLSRGPAMLLLFPLIAAFFLMVTAVTYQFRGWLASMMTNPRRRRTIIAVVTLLFILVFQIPNILNNLNPGARTRTPGRAGSDTRSSPHWKRSLPADRLRGKNTKISSPQNGPLGKQTASAIRRKTTKSPGWSTWWRLPGGCRTEPQLQLKGEACRHWPVSPEWG